jgi:hypothetical protein
MSDILNAPGGRRLKCTVCGAVERFTDKGRSYFDHDRSKHGAAETVRVDPLRLGGRATRIEDELEASMERIRKQREEEGDG